jgi:hypothetical protein
MKKKMMTILSGILFLLSASNLFAESITVHPTGNESVDVLAVQTAINNIGLGGTVLLKATNVEGIPTAFNFGRLEYNFDFPPNDPFGRHFSDINNHRLLINKGVVIQGERTRKGQMTTIQNGYQTFTIGSVMNTDHLGDVTIQGIHFKDSGLAGIVVANTKEQYAVTIKGNKFTGRLHDFFNSNEQDKPYLKPSIPWDSDGTAIGMMGGDGNDNTELYTPARRKEAWRKTFVYMYYNPPLNSWQVEGVLVGVAPSPGGVKGPVHVTHNYLNLEEESTLPSEFKKVWYETFVVFFLGSTGDALISQNIIKNGTARDINLLDLTGKAAVKGNEIEIGPLGSYHLNDPLWPTSVPPFLSKAAIAAVYKFFFPLFPALGGEVTIAENTITSSFPTKDAGGIQVFGMGASAWNSAAIIDNDIKILNGRHGIALFDTGATIGGIKTDGAKVVRNKIRGSGLYALRIGNMLKNQTDPLTADNIFMANNIAKFQATASGTSSPTLPPADVYLDTDTFNNVLVGYSGTVIDLGTSNRIIGQPRKIREGAGREVSEAMPMIFRKR